MELLLAKDGWVKIAFADGSVSTIHTSLNKDYLNSVGAELRQGFLFDLERLCYVKNRVDAVSVDVFADKPVYDTEVLQFASRFI